MNPFKVLLIALACIIAVGGCTATRPVVVGGAGVPARALPRVGTSPIDKPDPWEGMNRRIYRFNANFDRYVFLPALRWWRIAVPPFVRTGLSNLLAHVGQIPSLGNCVLQLSPRKTADTVGRLVVNTVVGVGGLLDPASGIGLIDRDEDFGQTLGRYGVEAGPYVVLPILGPSSLRDTTGTLVDQGAMSWLQNEIVGAFLLRHAYVYVPFALQYRDDTPFRYGELGPFEYDLIRYLYLEYRAIEVEL